MYMMHALKAGWGDLIEPLDLYKLQNLQINCKGDSGGMSKALEIVDKKFSGKTIENSPPIIGHCMQIGSLYARTMQHQDWWMTTPVTDIVLDTKVGEKHVVIFKTKNSVYLWVKE